MSDEELKNIWQHSTDDAEVAINTTQLGQELNIKLKKFERIVSRRNNREVFAALAIMPVFAVFGWFAHNAMTKTGAFLVIPYCMMVILVLRKVQRMKVQDISLPMTEYLSQYKTYLQKERSLLNNVLYWYITPAQLCFILIILGMHRYLLLVPCIGVGVFVYWINQRAVKHYFDPLIQRIAANIDHFK